MNAWVYVFSKDAGCYTVGFFSPTGEFHPDSDWPTNQQAAAQCHYLNGGSKA